MSHYSFTVQVSGIDPSRDDYENRLFESGCADALIAVIDGTLFVDFDRDADSYENAVRSAVRSVEAAGGNVVDVTRTHDSLTNRTAALSLPSSSRP
jgi:hypothetical protein